MEVDKGGRGNIVDNTYNWNAWSLFITKHSENVYIYIAQLRHHQENTDMYGEGILLMP